MGEKLQGELQYSEIKHLFTLGGAPVTSLSQIKDVKEGGVYVAVDKLPLHLPHVKFEGGCVGFVSVAG